MISWHPTAEEHLVERVSASFKELGVICVGKRSSTKSEEYYELFTK
jgi:hypothetical protein